MITTIIMSFIVAILLGGFMVYQSSKSTKINLTDEELDFMVELLGKSQENPLLTRSIMHKINQELRLSLMGY